MSESIVEKKDNYIPRLLRLYKEKIIPAMMEEFSYKNVMAVPRLVKISINMGIGEAVQDQKVVEKSIKELSMISGQKPKVTKARKPISNFKIRKGLSIGCCVTLRRSTMYEFLDRFISIALPRVRDFRGLSDKCFDGRGNYTIGIREQLLFPEINIDKVNKVMGMDVTLVTTAKTDPEAYELLKSFGMPFKKKEVQHN